MCRYSVYFKAFDENLRQVMFLFPRLVSEEDLEGVMYDVALMTLDEAPDVREITVVAYDSRTSLAVAVNKYGNPILIDEDGWEYVRMDVEKVCGQSVPTRLVIDGLDA